MTAITYTAKEKFVENGFNISGNDISLAAVDDSFNSVTTDLVGMLVDEFINVTSTAVDDGWHQVAVDSDSVSINTLSSLTDEAAGSVIQIIGYFHGPGLDYDLETAAHVIDQSLKTTSNISESLSGIKETIFLREVDYWDVVTDHVTESELQFWLEFFASVRSGETFTFDPYGTIAVPDDQLSCTLEGDPSFTRVMGVTKSYQISFKVRLNES